MLRGLIWTAVILELAIAMSTVRSDSREHYRKDGVRIQHDPFSPELAAKYGMPGETDDEGFNQYADTVGPGIYGGIVKRDEEGRVVIGKQYQNHNSRPGPVYAGGGYTPTIKLLHSNNPTSLTDWLILHPELANEVTTGGASPLHMCGMSRTSQLSTHVLLAHGADKEAVDTYGYRPLHRMASNNLAVGALALLEAGADPAALSDTGETAMQIARSSRALDVVAVLMRFLKAV
jgi:hypothetical protein